MICALQIYKAELLINPGTQIFVQLITNFWKVCNVKHPFIGHFQRDIYREPISGLQCPQLKYLRTFVIL